MVWAYILTIGIAIAAIMILALSGKKEPEEPDRCEHCNRWYECNGVDEACPWKTGERENNG